MLIGLMWINAKKNHRVALLPVILLFLYCWISGYYTTSCVGYLGIVTGIGCPGLWVGALVMKDTTAAISSNTPEIM